MQHGRRGRYAIGSLLTGFLITSCDPDASSSIRPALLSPVTKQFCGCGADAQCQGGTNRPRADAVVKIIMPRNLDMRALAREVRHQPSFYIDDETNDGRDDLTGNENGQWRPDPARPKDEPFHVITSPDLNDTRIKHVLVKVIIRNVSTAGYTFYDERGIHGVGESEPFNHVLCGKRPIQERRGNREVAKFYIDMNKLRSIRDSKLNYQPSFSIGIKSKDAPETPIFIDPKIRNEG